MQKNVKPRKTQNGVKKKDAEKRKDDDNDDTEKGTMDYCLVCCQVWFRGWVGLRVRVY